MERKPFFSHDCEACTFLGNGDINGQIADYYFCPGRAVETIIVRYSGDGPDYESTPANMITPLSGPHMNAAFGLYVRDNLKARGIQAEMNYVFMNENQQPFFRLTNQTQSVIF